MGRKTPAGGQSLLEPIIATNGPLTPASLRPYLQRCGYDPTLLFSDYHFSDQVAELAAFAQYPADARSACVAVINIPGDPEFEISAYRELGAPLVFVPREDHLQWWTQGVRKPEFRANIKRSELPSFFERHRDQFAPLAVYRAKTRGRFEKQFQLSFVDIGLVSLVEGEIGKALNRLVERVATEMKHEISAANLVERSDEWLFKSIFWLLAAKILKDKEVPTFSDLNLRDVQQVFSQVASHYGTRLFDQGANDPVRARALARASSSIAQFSNLRNVTSESLAYLYENALVSGETRKNLATHSTPGYLVDYIVWRLVPWIEQIPLAERNVFEPACGHAAFLVAALRVLRDLLPSSMSPASRREYLRERLHGIDLDAFALEIARLSLTLADIPNSDGWDLRRSDMFLDPMLPEQVNRATALLANPPFGRFSEQEETAFRQKDPNLSDEKATELLRRVLRDLQPGSVFGFIVPQSLLYSRHATFLRRVLVQDFSIIEVLLFPDKVFTFSGIETAVLLGHKPTVARPSGHLVTYKQVREADMERFRISYSVTTAREVPQARFAAHVDAQLLLPDLEELWLWCRYLPILGSIAKISKGLDYKSSVRSISRTRFPGAVQGFAHVAYEGRSGDHSLRRRREPAVMIHQLPPLRWMSLASDAIATARSGRITDIPQVLVNYVRVSRGPWRLKAFLDEKGHAVTSAFLTVRPDSEDYSLLFLWALCNSPIANAYVYSHTMKRHVLTGVFRRVPLPQATRSQIERVEDAARAYLQELKGASERPLLSDLDENEARKLLLRLDSEVLRLYGLPPRLERQLLDLFRGQQRPGVPFAFDQYFPEDFEPCFPLHVYLSELYARSTADRLAERHRNATSPVLLEALRNAVEAFEE
jgi:N-6 DNA methylase